MKCSHKPPAGTRSFLMAFIFNSDGSIFVHGAESGIVYIINQFHSSVVNVLGVMLQELRWTEVI